MRPAGGAADVNLLADRVTRVDWAIRALVAGTLLACAALVGWLIVAATEGGVHHVPVLHVDNQTHLTIQLTAVDSAGDSLTLGPRPPGGSTVHEVADIGRNWTFVGSYGGVGVFRQVVSRADLRARGWTLVIPSGATADLERQGFR
jgi:hypothetical protein